MLTSRREFNRRELRSLAIVAKGGMIRKVDEDTYLVRSSSLDSLQVNGWSSLYLSVDRLLRRLHRKSRSEATKRTYLNVIKRFCLHVGMSPDYLVQLDKKHIEMLVQDYCDMFNSPRYSRKYVNNILHILRSFFKANGFEINVEGYYVPARYRKRPEYIPTKNEVYEMADNSGSLRNRAIILMLYSTGLRVSTLVALLYGDLKEELERGYSIVKVPVYPEMKNRIPEACKSNVSYFTFASEEAVKALRLYLEDRRRRYGTVEPWEPLFCSEYNQISSDRRRYKFMTARTVQRVVKAAARNAGIKEWEYVTPHSLRKTYESVLRGELIDGGRLDVKTQEFFMGHILPGSQDAYYDRTKIESLRMEYARLNFGRKVVENKFRLLETSLIKAFEGTGIDWREALYEYVKVKMSL